MSALDDPGCLALDESGMLGHAEAAGTQFEKAWERYADVPAVVAGGCDGIVIGAMGGSAGAGDYLEAMFPGSPVPVVVTRTGLLPGWVGERTLVIACSYSGNTDETLNIFGRALEVGARAVAVTSGGKLGERAEAAGVPVVGVSYESMPRAALPHTFAALLRLGVGAGAGSVSDADVSAAARLHEAAVEYELGPAVPTVRNAAKQLALALVGRLPIVLGAEHLSGAAARFKNSLAENGKMLAAFDTLPEGSHNIVAGLAGVEEVRDTLAVVWFESQLYQGPADVRSEAALGRFERRGLAVHRIRLRGEGVLSQLLEASAWADFVSCYVGLVRGHDPTPIPDIEAIKAALA